MALSEAINRAIRDALWKSDFRLAEYEAKADGRTVRFLASTLLSRRLADNLAAIQAEFESSPGTVSDSSLTELISSGEGSVPASALLEQQLREQAAAAAPGAPLPAAGGLGELFIPKDVVTSKSLSVGSNPFGSVVINERLFLGRVSGIYMKRTTAANATGGIRISAFKGTANPPLAFDVTREDDLLPMALGPGGPAPFGGIGEHDMGANESNPGIRFDFNLLYEIVPPVRFVIRVNSASESATALFEIGEMASGLSATQQVTNNITESIVSRQVVAQAVVREREFVHTIMFDPRKLEKSFVALSESAFNSAVVRGLRADGQVPMRDIVRQS